MPKLMRDIHFESHQDHSFWFGSFTDFAKANSLTPGQMYDICEKLELVGEVIVRGCGETFYTLRKKTQPHVSSWMSMKQVVLHHA